MASFRTGFKIIGNIWLKQGLGRIRSFSEDRKPGQWLPEDQWAVRQPGSTCPDPCEKPKKPKVSKSWLSICKDPDAPKEPECDIRHNNCPPPVRSDAPWYSLEKLIPKKKQEKVPPPESCREEAKRRELFGSEEVCENMKDKTSLENTAAEPSKCCMPKEPCPAPVVTLSCPLPKELNIMLWCGQICPNTESSRVPAKCESDKLPYQEFRPQKVWKAPPFSLPIKNSSLFPSPPCSASSVDFQEFKHVNIPKPLYTRYKSVELCDSNFLFCMTEVQCRDDKSYSLGINPLSPPPTCSLACNACCRETVEVEKKEKPLCPEKRVIEAASRRPVPIKKATKYAFRPKPTKLVERRVYKNPLANKTCDSRDPKKDDESSKTSENDCECSEPPKVLTSTLTHEPQTYERHLPLTVRPPKWMYALCKPGSRETPLVPSCDQVPEEPDWCSETDGLRFYDNNNENITPLPPRDPYLAQKPEEKKEEPLPLIESKVAEPPASTPEFRDRFVLMPECYNIKNMRTNFPSDSQKDSEFSFEKFIEVKTAATLKTTKSFAAIKENILYDLQRLCPNPPLDPSKIKPPCRKPSEPVCPDPPRFHRTFSTFGPSALEKLRSIQLYKTQRRTECGDSSDKCKARRLNPKPKPCPEPVPKPDCAEITLPCCPKSRIPPDCSVKKPYPFCKKKLPPKPSFSECSKDPLPCPKITECNAWERVGKPRKYSDWAITRPAFDANRPVKEP